VTDDTRVVIGHSLGSVIAYEALCANPGWNIGGFVTLGSPLGIANLVFDRLLPNPENGKGAAPGGARTWVNVADAGDVVALVKELKPLFAGVTADVPVDNGAEAHFIKPYLTARETGQAILDGLGA
jgi:pimeloyl-ACP methyl ester carboxylesterase